MKADRKRQVIRAPCQNTIHHQCISSLEASHSTSRCNNPVQVASLEDSKTTRIRPLVETKVDSSSSCHQLEELPITSLPLSNTQVCKEVSHPITPLLSSSKFPSICPLHQIFLPKDSISTILPASTTTSNRRDPRTPFPNPMSALTEVKAWMTSSPD
jgi:hypothetical protein